MTIRTLLVLSLCVAGATPAGAGSSPTEQLRENADLVLKVLADPSLPPQDRLAELRRIAETVFDVDEAARRALAQHWRERTATEREEFARLFADLLEHTYLARIDRYGGETIRYVGETVDGDHAAVRARIVTATGGEIPVETRLLRRGGRWLIYDVLVGNVSLVGNYRAQFDQVIRTRSYAELVERLRVKRDELERTSSRTP
jgi:phospholipid transport system substrate-binding protein